MPVVDLNADELSQIINSVDTELVDVREPDEYDIISFDNSKLIPAGQVLKRMIEIDWKKKVIFVCRTGWRSARIAKLFSEDRSVYNLIGGIRSCFLLNKCKLAQCKDKEKINTYFK